MSPGHIVIVCSIHITYPRSYCLASVILTLFLFDRAGFFSFRRKAMHALFSIWELGSDLNIFVCAQGNDRVIFDLGAEAMAQYCYLRAGQCLRYFHFGHKSQVLMFLSY